MGPDDYISIDDCKPRHVYRIASRNLRIGVWDPESQGFIGIRVKFGSQYLFTEYHWDTGAPHGTVKPLEDLGELEDEHIRLIENLPSICAYCGTPIDYIRVEDPKSYNGKWEHIADTDCKKVQTRSPNNTILFDTLMKLEDEYYGKEEK